MSLRLGKKGEVVKAIQEMLNAIGTHLPEDGGDRYAPLLVDGDYGAKTERAVSRFQAEHGLLADGIVGPVTLKKLEEVFHATNQGQASPGADSLAQAPGRLSFERVPADAWGNGYGFLWLRSDVAQRYRNVFEAAHAVGAILTSAGGKRDLSAPVSAGRSATSFHYTGRALDLAVYSGMVNPAKDPYVVVGEGDRYHRVYARVPAQHADVTKLERVVTYKKRSGELTVEGSFLDLTALFDAQGFRRIRARPDFASGGSEIGAEWWHFQDETDLVAGKSTFGDELLRVYSRATLEPSPPWRFRDYVFGVNWR